jgi:hypothetical protein
MNLPLYEAKSAYADWPVADVANPADPITLGPTLGTFAGRSWRGRLCFEEGRLESAPKRNYTRLARQWDKDTRGQIAVGRTQRAADRRLRTVGRDGWSAVRDQPVEEEVS